MDADGRMAEQIIVGNVPSPPGSEAGGVENAEIDPGNDCCSVGKLRPEDTASPNQEVNIENCILSTSPRHSRTIIQSPIENQEKRFSSSTADFEINVPHTPPATPPRTVRRERSANQKEREALRSKQFSEAARLQRTAEKSEGGSDNINLGRRRKRYLHKHNKKGSTSSSGEALRAVEPPHEQLLTKMAFAEQQQWITVQQKTFTKW